MTNELQKVYESDDWKKLEKIDNTIILDYVWEDMEMMDTIREWIKDTYED
jgi:hypothetical protein|tara:strand:- start:2947 stop:3096 length:150 start_codon:yes stop_codon:yes gene_type:complete